MKFYRQSAVWTPNHKNFITVMQNEIIKTAKVVLGYFILSILTDLSEYNLPVSCEQLKLWWFSAGRIPCRYRVNGVFIVSSVYTTEVMPPKRARVSAECAIANIIQFMRFMEIMTTITVSQWWWWNQWCSKWLFIWGDRSVSVVYIFIWYRNASL